MEQENRWRGEKTRGWGGETGERRCGESKGAGGGGCLIYWFNSCQCPSLCLSVREGKWSMQPKTPRPNHIFSQLLSLPLIVPLPSLSISHSISHSPSSCLSTAFSSLFVTHLPTDSLSRHPLALWTQNLPVQDSYERICISGETSIPPKSTCKNDHPLNPFIRLIIHVIGDGVLPVGSHLSNKSQVGKFIPNHRLHIITPWTRGTVDREENCRFPMF